MNDHALEVSWWPDDPKVVKVLPSSSLMSFSKYSIITGHEIEEDNSIRQWDLDGDGTQDHLERDTPQQCIIQIGSHVLHLHAKWSPLLMVIQLIQAAALQASMTPSGHQHKAHHINLLKLMWFYDSLLQQFAQDAAVCRSSVGGAGPLPEDWMPETMHRCLTRLEINIPHSRASLEKHSAMLLEAYGQPRNHFKYDYYGYTKIHDTTFKDAFHFIGAKDVSTTFEILQYELKLYGLHSDADPDIDHDRKDEPEMVHSRSQELHGDNKMLKPEINDSVAPAVLTQDRVKRLRGRPRKQEQEVVRDPIKQSPRHLRSESRRTLQTNVDPLSQYPPLTPPSPTKPLKRVHSDHEKVSTSTKRHSVKKMKVMGISRRSPEQRSSKHEVVTSAPSKGNQSIPKTERGSTIQKMMPVLPEDRNSEQPTKNKGSSRPKSEDMNGTPTPKNWIELVLSRSSHNFEEEATDLVALEQHLIAFYKMKGFESLDAWGQHVMQTLLDGDSTMVNRTLRWVGKVREEGMNQNLQFPHVQQIVVCCIRYLQKKQMKGGASKRVEERST